MKSSRERKWHQRLLTKGIASFWGFLFGIFWSKIWGIAISALPILINWISDIPPPVIHGAVGAILAFGYLLLIDLLRYLLRIKYWAYKLTPIQIYMIWLAGNESADTIAYQCVFDSLELPKEHRGVTHGKRHQLQDMNILTYENAEITLTKSGRKLFDKEYANLEFTPDMLSAAKADAQQSCKSN